MACSVLSLTSLTDEAVMLLYPVHKLKEIEVKRPNLRNRMLGVDKSTGFGDYGAVQWEVCGCLFLTNLLLFLSLFKGVKVLEKVSWITAAVPYLAIAVLLVRGLTLSNAAFGIRTFLTPQFSKLLDWDIKRIVNFGLKVFFTESVC
ncbi:unnamed protein product [Heterobilharzia americana]|nr:unnamed protein product [Heterobilharzia americana]